MLPATSTTITETATAVDSTARIATQGDPARNLLDFIMDVWPYILAELDAHGSSCSEVGRLLARLNDVTAAYHQLKAAVGQAEPLATWPPSLEMFSEPDEHDRLLELVYGLDHATTAAFALMELYDSGGNLQKYADMNVVYSLLSAAHNEYKLSVDVN